MTRVAGPTSITEWTSSRYDMHVYVLGDYHQRGAMCPNGIPIDEFLRDVVNRTQARIDLYVETAYPLGKVAPPYEKGPSHSYMDDVVSAFDTCFLLNGDGCAHDNLRAHCLDFRLVYDNPAVYVLDLASWANVTSPVRATLPPQTREDMGRCLDATLHNLEHALRGSNDLLEVIRLMYDRKDVILQKRESLGRSMRVLVDQFLHHRILTQREEGSYGSFDLRTLRDELRSVRMLLSGEGPIDTLRVDELLRGFMFASNYALDMYVLYSLMGSDGPNAIVYVGALHAQGVNTFLRDWVHFREEASYTDDNLPQCVTVEPRQWFVEVAKNDTPHKTRQ